MSEDPVIGYIQRSSVNFVALIKMLKEKGLFDEERYQALREEEHDEFESRKMDIVLGKILTPGVLAADRTREEESDTDEGEEGDG